MRVATDALRLLNPHSVLAAIQARPKDVVRIGVDPARHTPAWGQVLQAAQKAGIPCSGQLTGGRGSQERQGASEAWVLPRSYEYENFFTGPENSVWVALDSLEDPQNVGAIVRSAAFFGVRGIVMTELRSAPLSATVYDIASGGMEAVPCWRVTNLQRALEKAKEASLWVLGTSEHAKTSLRSVPRDRSWLFVVGNEEKGVRRLTAESCDMMCGIPSVGNVVTSLNVSVATALVLGHLGNALE